MRAIQDWFRRMVFETGFLDAYPHFAPNLATIDAYEDEHCIMAVSAGSHGRVRLHINPPFFELQPAAFRAVLQHELHHVICGHLDPAYSTVAAPNIMQVAKEITANEYIAEALPGTPYQWRDHAQHGIRPGQDTWQRYELLVKAHDEGRYQPPPMIRIRCCGPGEGDPDAPPMPPRLADALRQAGAGTRPGSELAVGTPADARIDWAHQLWRFARSRVQLRQSLRRPSRRDPACARIGELPGRSRLPTWPRLLIAIDTSSSMEQELFPRIAGELQAIARCADLVIVECDRSIQREYGFSGTLPTVVGRGGTDLRPVFAPDVLRRHRPDGVVYFTDGDGPFPQDDPGTKTLWVLTASRPFACPWGARVAMTSLPAAPRRTRLEAIVRLDEPAASSSWR